MGRSFDEPGWGGALIVTIDSNHRVTLESRRYADKRYMVERLDVTGLDSDADVAGRVQQLIESKNYGSETSLRVILTGEVAPTAQLSASGIARIVGAGPEYIELRDETVPVFDAGYLENDMTLRGALYRELLPLLRDGDSSQRIVAADALRAGLAAIDGRTILPDAPSVEVEQ